MKTVLCGLFLSLALSNPTLAQAGDESRYDGVDGIVTVSPDPIERAGLLAIEQIKQDLYNGLDILGQVQASLQFNLNFPHPFVVVNERGPQVSSIEVSAE